MRFFTLSTVAFGFGVGLQIAGTAFAATSPYSATLVKPLASDKEVVLENVIFECSGSTCTEATRDDSAASTNTCHLLMRQVGDVSAYGSPSHPFDADKLAKCNAK